MGLVHLSLLCPPGRAMRSSMLPRPPTLLALALAGCAQGSSRSPTPTPPPPLVRASSVPAAIAEADPFPAPNSPSAEAAPSDFADSRWGPNLQPLDIKRGITPLKARVRECGQRHGIRPGTKIPVKFVVDGTSGRTSSTTILEGYAGTPVGDCVQQVTQDSSFRAFPANSQAFTFKFKI